MRFRLIANRIGLRDRASNFEVAIDRSSSFDRSLDFEVAPARPRSHIIETDKRSSLNFASARRRSPGVGRAFWGSRSRLVVWTISFVVALGFFDGTTRGGDFSKLKPKIDAELRSDLKAHWYPHAVDRERGGFHQNMADDWSLLDDPKASIVYQARMTWTAAAFAAFSPADRQEYLGYARHGIAFLDGAMRDRDHGGFFWEIDRDRPIAAAERHEKHAYGLAFVIYAAATVYEITHDEIALKTARDAFDFLDSHAHDTANGGYFEALERDGSPLARLEPAAPPSTPVDRLGIPRGYKTMNSHIHLLEALTVLARIDKREVVQNRFHELFLIVRDKIAVEPGALNLYLTVDWRAVPGHDSFGHDVEAAYLLEEAARELNLADDPKTRRVARDLVDHALDHGWDGEFGGFYDKGEAIAAPPFDLEKIWWTQYEGLNALLLMHKQYGGETDRYANAFQMQWKFIEDYMIDPKHGGAVRRTTRDGKIHAGETKADAWKANYHASRALMNVSKELESVGNTKK
jgi:mannobiose 2-epimerase